MSKSETGQIGWIDLTVDKAEELRQFYQEVVGWDSHRVEMGGYNDFSMVPAAGGKAVAGICHARGGNADLPPQWLIYIYVDDLEQSMDRCKRLGGRIVTGPKGSGGQGRYCVVQDPAGAVAALFEPAS